MEIRTPLSTARSRLRNGAGNVLISAVRSRQADAGHDRREATRRLGGLVQVDDAYLEVKRNGGKAAGSENKRPFVIGVSTSDAGHPRHVVITPVPGFTKVALTDWTQRHLQPETDVYSDGLGAFLRWWTWATRTP